MNIEGKTIFINTLKRKMVEAIKEIMPCNFHVEINEITETDNVDSYHGETTFVISHKTPFGKLEVFHYYYKQDLMQVMIMELYPYTFAAKHLLEKAKSKTLPPILNFRANKINSIGHKLSKGILEIEQIEMTREEYKGVMPFYKEFYYSECQTFRIRTVELVDGVKAVYLVDSKIHTVPDSVKDNNHNFSS